VIKRSLKIALELSAVIVAGLSILLVVAALRLSMGPISLAFLTPYIERGLSTEDGSVKVALEETILDWAGWDRTLDILARGVRVTGPNGGEKAYVPEIAISLSLRALLEGRVAPTRLALIGPRLRVVRAEDGRLGLGDPPPAPASPDIRPAPRIGSDFAALVIERLTGPPDRSRPLGYLRSLVMANADLIFDDQREKIVLNAPGSEVVLTRNEEGIIGSARVNLRTGDADARIDLDAAYTTTDGTLGLETRFRGLEPAGFAGLSPDLAHVGGLRLPLTGKLVAHMNLDGVVRDLSLDVTVGAGTVSVKAIGLDAVAVRSARITARATDNLSRFTLDEFRADLGGPQLVLTGNARRADGRLSAGLEATARDVTTEDLKRLWPENAAPGGRRWVGDNVEGGGVRELRASAEITARENPESGFSDVNLARLEGRFEFSGVTAHYLRPLPPVTDLSGTAVLVPDAIDFAVESGRLGEVSVKEGKIRVHGLETPDHVLDLEVVAEGPLSAALTVLDHPRLDLVKELGISPAATGGMAATRLVTRIPLLKDLRFEQMGLAAASNMRGVRLAGAVLGHDLTDGDLRLQVDTRGMDIEGTASLGGVPARFGWRENFSDGAPYRSRYTVKGVADAAARERFGVDAAPYVTGPVGIEATITRHRGDRANLAAVLDLERAGLEFAEVGWSKAPGVPGSGRLAMTIENERIRALERVTVEAGDLKASGRVAFGPDGGLDRFEFGEFAFGETDIRLRGQGRSGGGLALEITGKKVDIRPFLESSDAQEPREAREDGEVPKRPLDITVDVAEVRAGPGAVISRVRGTLQRDTRVWRQVRINGEVGDGRPLGFSIVPEKGGRRLRIASDDGGAALKAFDIADNMAGGLLTITGRFDDAKPGRPLAGRFELKKFQMFNAPFLAKLLSVLSLTGILDALTGQGISFERAEVPFAMTGDILEIKEARAYGSALGFTASGWMDIDKGTIDLAGTAVPAYTLNSVFGDIPLLGPILTGEKGSGVFAATYRARGKLDDPDISTNPLATLAPGFLRGLFDIFDTPPQKPPASKGQGPESDPQPAPGAPPVEQPGASP